MQYRRVLAIGDMHGKFSRLLNLIHKVNFDPETDLLILLGDYIDRGDENMRCLRWAIEMSKKPNVIALRGNHEHMMLCYYLLGGSEASIWLPNGGAQTKRELDIWLRREPDALKTCLDFINERPLYHQMFIDGKEYIFVHAGLQPGVPLEQQTEESLLWQLHRLCLCRLRAFTDRLSYARPLLSDQIKQSHHHHRYRLVSAARKNFLP